MASVTSLTLTDSGQRYTSVPNVIIAVPDADSTTATATASKDSAGDGVNYVSVAEIGNYYTTAPAVTFAVPTTDSANATAIVSATDSDRITGISVVDSGIYYTTAPNVTIGVPSLDSATATATANMSGGVMTTATLTSAGRYYSRRPTVSVAYPLDSSVFNKISYVYKKFGKTSLHHNDSTDTTSLTDLVNTDYFDSFYASTANKIVETSFWVYLDSIKAGTFLYNNDIRLHMDSEGYVGATFSTFGTSIGDSATSYNSLTKYNTETPLSTGSWTFLQFQTLHESALNLSTKLRISVNGSYDSTYDVTPGLLSDSAWNYNYYDSGDTFTIGADLDSLGPRVVSRNLGPTNFDDVVRSFNGYMDNFTFTTLSASTFDSDQSIRIPSSATDYYYSTTPVIHQAFDYRQAFILASIDSGVVTSLLVTESGVGYTSTPTITIDDPTGSKADYRATATASVNSSTGKIDGVTVTFPGRFYDSDVNPTVTIDSATGTAADYRAHGTAVVTNGSVTSITLTDSGRHYLVDPEVTIEGPTGTAADFRATGRVWLDSDSRKIRRIALVDGGRFYETVPAVTIGGGDGSEDFAVGETASQTLSTGVIISGEVAKWSDSDNLLYLIHNGADDGTYHSFVTGLPIVGATSGANGNVLSVNEDNKISSNEQNDEFSPSGSSELSFLDFTEDNPFGDPENN